MYKNSYLLFPHEAIPALAEMRGPQWQALVRHIISLPETHEETLAFMLMMIQLNNCYECETDSFRAMRGCTACAVQTLRRFKGEDSALLEAYASALTEIRSFAESSKQIFYHDKTLRLV